MAGSVAGAGAAGSGAHRDRGEEEKATLMPLLYIRRYTRDLIQSHPDWLFVFEIGKFIENSDDPPVSDITKHMVDVIMSLILDDYGELD